MIEKCRNSVECRFELRRTALFKSCVLDLCCRLATLFASKNTHGFQTADITHSRKNSPLRCVIDGEDPQIKCSEIQKR